MIRVMGWSLNQSPAQHSVLNQQQWQLVRVINDQPYVHVDALAKDLKFKLGTLQSELLYLEMGAMFCLNQGVMCSVTEGSAHSSHHLRCHSLSLLCANG